MKDGLENIDEIFKQAFDGFEANVDPSVWSNVQNSIGSGGANATPQIDPSAVTGIAGKSMAFKIVAGVALLGTVATATYLAPKMFENKESIVAENVVAEDDLMVVEEKLYTPTYEEQNKETVKDVSVATEEIKSNNITVETAKTERLSNSSNVVENNAELTDNTTNQVAVMEDNSNENLAEEEVIVGSNKPNSTNKEESVKLLVNINVDINKGKAPLTVQFDAWGENVAQYFWDFSDGSDEVNGDAPVHTFVNEGTYRVKLTGQDKMGNTKAAYTTIVVEKDYSSSLQELPNIFSPNGDGINDIIKIKGKNIEKIQVQIADSKGKPVFFMNSLDDIWEGKDQSGNYLIQGQYYMTVVAVGKDGKKHLKKSAINLRR